MLTVVFWRCNDHWRWFDTISAVVAFGFVIFISCLANWISLALGPLSQQPLSPVLCTAARVSFSKHKLHQITLHLKFCTGSSSLLDWCLKFFNKVFSDIWFLKICFNLENVIGRVAGSLSVCVCVYFCLLGI